MPQINLLPWREELRRRRNRDFGVLAVIAFVVMCVVVAGVHLNFEDRIGYQNARNAFLEGEISKLNEKIKEIRDIKREKERLIARTNKIQQLQSGRPDIVHLMDELVATLPDGVYYTKLQQQGGKLVLNGIAQSNARVSSLMRQLEASEWLEDPVLVEIKAETRGQGQDAVARNSTFTLGITQTKKIKDEEQSGG